MQDPNMERIVKEMMKLGNDAMKKGDSVASLSVAGASGTIAALCQLNATLEEIRDAIKESKS